jgi:hypothetical protein
MKAKILNRFVDEAGVVFVVYSYVVPRKNEITFPIERAKFAGAIAALGAKRNNLINVGIRAN